MFFNRLSVMKMPRLRVALFLLLFIVDVTTANSGSAPIVEIRHGKLKGSVLKSYNGRDYHAFKGVPYAKPTSGLLRFKVRNTRTLRACFTFLNLSFKR